MEFRAVPKRDPSTELTHFKYIKREKVGDKWKYYYDTEQLKEDLGVNQKKKVEKYNTAVKVYDSEKQKALDKAKSTEQQINDTVKAESKKSIGQRVVDKLTNKDIKSEVDDMTQQYDKELVEYKNTSDKHEAAKRLADRAVKKYYNTPIGKIEKFFKSGQEKIASLFGDSYDKIVGNLRKDAEKEEYLQKADEAEKRIKVREMDANTKASAARKEAAKKSADEIEDRVKKDFAKQEIAEMKSKSKPKTMTKSMSDEVIDRINKNRGNLRKGSLTDKYTSTTTVLDRIKENKESIRKGSSTDKKASQKTQPKASTVIQRAKNSTEKTKTSNGKLKNTSDSAVNNVTVRRSNDNTSSLSETAKASLDYRKDSKRRRR